MKPGPWAKDGKCYDHPDPSIFFAPGRGVTAVEGLRVCIGCPVRSDCLEWALSGGYPLEHGVLGGTIASARFKVRTGRMSRRAAMDAGDRLAESTTVVEREPWLDADVA